MRKTEKDFNFIFVDSNNLDYSKILIDDQKKIEKKMFKITVCEYLKYFFKKSIGMKLDYESKKINKAQEIMVELLDISKILQKINEIEKLKYVLLDENQIELFEKINKPFFPSQEIEKNHKQNKKLLLQNESSSFSFYTDINRRLFQLYQTLNKKFN